MPKKYCCKNFTDFLMCGGIKNNALLFYFSLTYNEQCSNTRMRATQKNYTRAIIINAQF
jgi:hypothetical protein